jgi:hypothetical protein
MARPKRSETQNLSTIQIWPPTTSMHPPNTAPSTPSTPEQPRSSHRHLQSGRCASCSHSARADRPGRWQRDSSSSTQRCGGRQLAGSPVAGLGGRFEPWPQLASAGHASGPGSARVMSRVSGALRGQRGGAQQQLLCHAVDGVALAARRGQNHSDQWLMGCLPRLWWPPRGARPGRRARSPLGQLVGAVRSRSGQVWPRHSAQSPALAARMLTFVCVSRLT